jgi:hypothetical protein
MHDIDSPAPRRARSRRVVPAVLGDAHPGDLVAVHIRITATIGGQPFGRLVAGDRASELMPLPPEATIAAVLELAP